jgi:uncharacterized membrane protein
MAEFVYSLCTLTALGCAFLLFRRHRAYRSSLLFWSSLCFLGLAINNVMLLIDLYAFPNIDLFVARTAVALVAMLMLLYGLIRASR